MGTCWLCLALKPGRSCCFWSPILGSGPGPEAEVHPAWSCRPQGSLPFSALSCCSASGTRHLSPPGFWKHPLNPGSLLLGGVAVTDRTPPTEHRAPGACTPIQLQTGHPLSARSKAPGTQARGHHHHQPLRPHWVPSERPPCQDGCCPQGRGDARGGALHAGVGLMRPGAGPVPSGPNPPTRHTGGIAKTTLCGLWCT